MIALGGAKWYFIDENPKKIQNKIEILKKGRKNSEGGKQVNQ